MALRGLFHASVFGLATLLSACSGSQEPAATDEEFRVAQAYADLTLLSESARLGKMADTTRTYELQTDSVLQVYGLKKEEFERAFQRLANDPERSRLLFDLASKRIQALRARRDSSASRL